MKRKSYACDPERVEKGGRHLKIPFTNERANGGQDATGMSDCEDKPHTRDDRVFFRAADGPVKEDADARQGYKKEKPAKCW